MKSMCPYVLTSSAKVTKKYYKVSCPFLFDLEIMLCQMFLVKSRNRLAVGWPAGSSTQQFYTAKKHKSTVSVLGREEGYIPIRLKEFPRAKPEGTPKGGGVYLTVYPESSPNTDSISLTDPV